MIPNTDAYFLFSKIVETVPSVKWINSTMRKSWYLYIVNCKSNPSIKLFQLFLNLNSASVENVAKQFDLWKREEK